MPSSIEYTGGVLTKPELGLDYYKIVQNSIEVETDRWNITPTIQEFDITPYRVVIIRNPSSSNVYLSSYPDGSKYITIEPGMMVGIGLELAKISNKVYLWGDANVTVEVLKIR